MKNWLPKYYTGNHTHCGLISKKIEVFLSTIQFYFNLQGVIIQPNNRNKNDRPFQKCFRNHQIHNENEAELSINQTQRST